MASTRGREIRLKTCAIGLPRADDFEIVDVPRPDPRSDEVLLRNRYSRISASLRMMISEAASDVPGVPFPALRPGDTLAEEALGEVVSAPMGSGLVPGDLVLHSLGYREYAAVPLSDCVHVGTPLPQDAAHLSHGWTAYAALTQGVQILADDTVFVTSGAGAIGSMAGQIARLLGAGKIIGSTGSKEKAQRMVEELGYDAAVIRGVGPIGDQLMEVAPGGLDVVLDSVGGEQLKAAVGAARQGARFVIVGALSGQLASGGTGRIAPVELDSFQLLLKKLTMRGYSADDDPDVRAEWTQRFAAWLQSGDISFPHVVVTGIEAGPEAIQAVAEGKYFGTVLMKF